MDMQSDQHSLRVHIELDVFKFFHFCTFLVGVGLTPSPEADSSGEVYGQMIIDLISRACGGSPLARLSQLREDSIP